MCNIVMQPLCTLLNAHQDKYVTICQYTKIVQYYYLINNVEGIAPVVSYQSASDKKSEISWVSVPYGWDNFFLGKLSGFSFNT